MTPIALERDRERSGRLDLTGIDLGAFARWPLSTGALRCLRYMHDIEHHTMCYLRDLLGTPAHRDPRITAFLSRWAYEELWHGEAIASVLTAHGEEARVARLRQGRRWRWRDALDRALHVGAASLAGEAFVAVHMAWGAVNEWTTQAGYGRLATPGGHPVLSDLLRRIMRQEGGQSTSTPPRPSGAGPPARPPAASPASRSATSGSPSARG